MCEVEKEMRVGSDVLSSYFRCGRGDHFGL